MKLLKDANRIWREQGTLPLFREATGFVCRETRIKIESVGNRRECPICRCTTHRFLPRGNNRLDARCPQCDSKERQRLLWTFLLQDFGIERKEKLDVLYFAPDKSIEQQFRSMENVNCTTTDLILSGVNINADITDLPFDNGSFDMVICSHVLEHVPDDMTGMAEMHRVLRDDGSLFIMVPTDESLDETFEDPTITSPEGRTEAFGQEDHVRYYGLDIVDRLTEVGLDVSTITYADNLPLKIVERQSLIPESEEYEPIFFCQSTTPHDAASDMESNRDSSVSPTEAKSGMVRKPTAIKKPKHFPRTSKNS